MKLFKVVYPDGIIEWLQPSEEVVGIDREYIYTKSRGLYRNGIQCLNKYPLESKLYDSNLHLIKKFWEDLK